MEQDAAPAGEACNLTPGRLRGSARWVLRPICKELAGLVTGRTRPRPRKRGPELKSGYAVSFKCRSGASEGERPDRKGRPAGRRKDKEAPSGAPLPSLARGDQGREGRARRPPKKPKPRAAKHAPVKSCADEMKHHQRR